MRINEKVCNLECVKKGDVHEFVGPVKILMVDPPKDEYKLTKQRAATLTLTTAMIGANTLCVLLFCLGFTLPDYINTHIILCFLGYQFCMPFGILMLHSLFGAAAPMTKLQRKCQHFCLQFLGMLLYGAGSAMAIVLGEKSSFDPPQPYTSLHFYSGSVAAGFAALCFLTGPFVLCLHRISPCITYIHRFFGILSFVSSTMCFILGIWKPIMYLWFYVLGQHMITAYMVTGFSALYTISVITAPVSKFICKRNKSPT